MAEGKILVVALLLIIIFLGITAFLFYLEKRIRASEKKLKQLEEDSRKKGKMSL
ncbi:MAG: hypothetical protein ACLFN2_01450 [Bacteroidales bacterium]